jgi:conjugative transfer signal peptidase TraF
MQPGVSGDTHARTARARRTWSSLVLGVLVLAAVVSTRWVRLNLSPSLPSGLYRLTALRAPLTRGTLVVLPAPVRVRPWHAAWVPLLKPVAAVAGELVCVADEGLWVAGVPYGRVYREAGGKALPRMEGCHRLQDGEVFLASAQPRSLDGRYFGPTLVTALTAQAIPVWTWR